MWGHTTGSDGDINVAIDPKFFKVTTNACASRLVYTFILSFDICFKIYIPLSIVYATWSGVGIFLVALLSYGFFGEVLRWQALVGLVFIVIGVTMVNYFSNPTSY